METWTGLKVGSSILLNCLEKVEDGTLGDGSLSALWDNGWSIGGFGVGMWIGTAVDSLMLMSCLDEVED